MLHTKIKERESLLDNCIFEDEEGRIEYVDMSKKKLFAFNLTSSIELLQEALKKVRQMREYRWTAAYPKPKSTTSQLLEEVVDEAGVDGYNQAVTEMEEFLLDEINKIKE